MDTERYLTSNLDQTDPSVTALSNVLGIEKCLIYISGR